MSVSPQKVGWSPYLTLSVSVALSASVLFLVLSQVSISEVVAAIAGANRYAVSAFLVASFSSSFFRTWRFRTLLAGNGFSTPFPSMFLIVLVRNTFSDLLPARLGTLIYIFLTTTRLGIPFGAAGASFSLAFLFDIVALVPLVALCAVLAGTGIEVSVTGLLLGAGTLLILSCSLLLLLPRALRLTSHLCTTLLSEDFRFRTKVLDALSSVAEGIEHTRRSGVYGRVLALSVLVRLCKYAGLYLFLYAMLQPQGYSLAELPFPKVFLGLCASELSASLPISGIAGIGAYQSAWIATFTLLGFPLSLATLTSVGHHLFTQAYGYSLGAAAFLLVLLPVFKRDLGPAVSDVQAPHTFVPSRLLPSNLVFLLQLCSACGLILVLVLALLRMIEG